GGGVFVGTPLAETPGVDGQHAVTRPGQKGPDGRHASLPLQNLTLPPSIVVGMVVAVKNGGLPPGHVRTEKQGGHPEPLAAAEGDLFDGEAQTLLPSVDLGTEGGAGKCLPEELAQRPAQSRRILSKPLLSRPQSRSLHRGVAGGV